MCLKVIGYGALWIFVSLYIFTCGTLNANPHYPYGNITWDDGVKRALWMYILGLFWNIALSIAMQEFVVATACSIWYFGRRDNNVHSPVFKGFSRSYTYSFGSLCLGSGILSVVWLI